MCAQLARFRATWEAEHKRDPERFPLDGLTDSEWVEQFLFWLQENASQRLQTRPSPK